MGDRLKNSNEAATYRNKLLKEQGGLDLITGEKVHDPVLDHAHFGEQRCRGVLQRECNSFEGKVANAFNRYMKHLTDKPIHEILRNLADYLEQDNSDKPIHHTALTVDVKKFCRKSAEEQKQLLLSFNVQPESNQKRANQARKLIKEGKLKI